MIFPARNIKPGKNSRLLQYMRDVTTDVTMIAIELTIFGQLTSCCTSHGFVMDDRSQAVIIMDLQKEARCKGAGFQCSDSFVRRAHYFGAKCVALHRRPKSKS